MTTENITPESEDKTWMVVLDGERNKDMIEFITEMENTKKVSRARVLREILYYGKMKIEELKASGEYKEVLQDKI